MTLEQLEECKKKCERLHSRFMIDEAISSGFTLGSVAYDMVFPTGIPVGKGKRLRFDGVGDAIRDKFFDSRKTVGFSFSRFISKHNIHVSDEITLAIALGKILLTQAKIVDVDAEKNKEASEEKGTSETKNKFQTRKIVEDMSDYELEDV